MPLLRVLGNVTPPVVLLTAGVANVVATLGGTQDVYITHGGDGAHKVGSFHKRYAALDIRTKNLTGVTKEELFQKLVLKFPRPRFDVLFEDRGGDNEHIHIEDNTAPETPLAPEVLHT